MVVRNNRAEFNVAGIEIENTVHADVHGNVAVNNTGGILVFNMPDVPQRGHSTRVFDNPAVGNNTANFGAPGSAVASVPAGSGIFINVNDLIEAFGNEVADNQTANVLTSGYFNVGYSAEREVADVFDPCLETIFIHGDAFSGGNQPDHEGLAAVRMAHYGTDGRLRDIVWDGVSHPERTGAEHAVCVDDAPVEVLNVDGDNGYANPSIELEAYRCTRERLAAVVLAEA